MMHRSMLAMLALVFIGMGACAKKSDENRADGHSGASASQAGGGKKDAQDKSDSKASDTVRLSATAQQCGSIRVEAVEVRSLPRTLMVTGQVQMDEQHTWHLGVLADGRITAVNVLAGAMVRRGQTLAELHSHTVHETVGALAQAYAAVERQRGALTFSQQARDRYAHLYNIQAASLEESQRADQEVQQAKNMLAVAQANVRMEAEHLSELLQVPAESLTPTTLYSHELIPVRAVADGTVIKRNVTVGQVVDTGFEAFTISNLSTVWVLAAVNEQDLSFLHNRAKAQLTTSGYPQQVFAGRVTMIGSTLDSETRTVPVRITVPNEGTHLRPGMFASVQIDEPALRKAVFVPEEALQDINGVQVVFVTGDGVLFRAQAVKIGTRSQGRAEIVEGLLPNDRIVTAGAFMVKAEMLRGTMGEG